MNGAEHVAPYSRDEGAERRRLLLEWNDTAFAHPDDGCLHEVFAAQAARAPEAEALSFEGQGLSYGALNERANRLAHALRRHGVRPETLVGVFMERSLEMVVALLGVLKAGGAYVPLDPEYPEARLAFMLADARPPVILTQARLAGSLPAHAAVVIRVDAEWGSIAGEPAHDPPRDGLTLESLAYVIYTSGSTGRPKGAMNAHRGVKNRLAWMQRAYGLRAADAVLQKTPLSFDVSVWELFWPLMFGARMVIARPGGHRDPRYLAGLIAERGVTTLHFVPSMLGAFLDEPRVDRCRGLTRAFASGEALAPALVERFFARLPEVELHNLYGPTEAAVDVTAWACRRGAAVVPIGRPIDNVRVHILDERMEPVPTGAPGELYIGGVAVGRGYLNRPELTAERFVRDPFAADPAARLYKTGDVARWLPSGEIEYLGRADFQIKIRGFRVELGEIEAALLEHPGVRDAVVVAREDAPGDKRLAAYLTARGGAAPAASELRSHLQRTLPDHMVPAAFVALDQLPRLASGKIDRRALPAPSEVASAASGPRVAPREAIELELRSIWEEVLGVEGIGVRDDFFELGGHSLLALKLFDRIEKTFGITLPLATIVEAPVIEKLAAILRQEGFKPQWASLVPLQPGGSKPPFFCVHGGGGYVLFYRPLANRLGPDQPFYGLQPWWLTDGSPAPARVDVPSLATRYLEEIRQLQPRGPYYLGGASYGGMIALEIAQQLVARGERIALLLMFDTYGRGYHAPARSTAERLRRAPAELYLKIEHHAGSVRMLEHADRAAYLKAKWRKAVDETGEAIDAWVRHAAKGVFTRLGRPLPKLVAEVPNLMAEAVQRYQPRDYPGRITLFRAHRQAPGAAPDPTLGWGGLAKGGVEIHPAPGYHSAMISEPRVRFIAGEVGRCLDGARAAQKRHGEASGAAEKARRPVAASPRARLNVALIAEEGAGLEMLKMLAGSDHRVAMVLSSPPGAQRAPIWSHAAEKGYRLLPAQRVRDPAFAQVIRDERVDVLLNVHSLHIVKAPILEAARIGAFNMHPGPLPRYAGMNPSSWAIYRGEARHGVTVHRMLAGIDTGPIAYQTLFDLHDEDTGLSVTLRCVREGLKLLELLLETAATDPDAIPRIPQDASQREYFGREVPEGGAICWARPAAEVHRFFRAFSYHPYPSPWGYPRTTLGGREVAVVDMALTGEPATAKPGTVARGRGSSVRVAAADAWLSLNLVRIDGSAADPAQVLPPGVCLGGG